MARRSAFGKSIGGIPMPMIIGLVVVIAAAVWWFMIRKQTPLAIPSEKSLGTASEKIQTVSTSATSDVAASVTTNNANIATAAAASGDITTAKAATEAAITSATAAINNTSVTNASTGVAVSSVGAAALATSQAAIKAGKALVNIPITWKYIYPQQDLGGGVKQYPGLYSMSVYFTYSSNYYTPDFFKNIFPPRNATPFNDSGLGLCTLFNATDGTLRSSYAKNNTNIETMPLDRSTTKGDIYYFFASYIIKNGGLSSEQKAALQQIITSLAS